MTPALVEVSDAPMGLTEIKVKDSRGKRICFLQVAADDLDDELIADLYAFQGRHAHRVLELMRASASSA